MMIFGKECNKEDGMLDSYSTVDKVVMRICFYGFLGVGIYGMFLSNIWAGIMYTLFVVLGNIYMLGACLCSHCPYPYKYSSCLFLPHEWIKKFYVYRAEPMTFIEKMGVVLVMVGLVVIPQYALIEHLNLFFLFWIMVLPFLFFPVIYCKKCRHLDCPGNRASGFQEIKNKVD